MAIIPDLKDVGQESVREARAAMVELVANLHTLLDRCEIDIHIKLKPKDELANS